MRRAARPKHAALCATAAVALVAVVSTGCDGTGGEAHGSDAGAVVRASWTDPQNPLEPANINEVQGGKVLDMTFRGLKRYNPRTGQAENWVAESVESTDARTFTVRLRSGWKFSNGEPVTSDSFIKAWNYAALVTNRQINAPFFSYIEGYGKVHPASGAPTASTLSGLRKTGRLSFTVRLNQKFSTWPDILGYSAFYPLPTVFFTAHSHWLDKPIGNGPYKVDSYVRGQQMTLSRWDGYPGPDKAANDGVALKVYTDTDTAYTDLLAGNLDLADDIPASQLRNARADLGDRYLNQPAGIIQTLAFPMYDKRWSGKNSAKLRRGISMAVNREQITRQIFGGTRTPASDWTSPVLGAPGGYRPGLCGEACGYDPAKARKLIRQGGGIPGGTMKITYNADTGSHKQWVDAVCNSVNNALGDDHACVGNPVGTFADYRGRIHAKRMPGPFRAGWQMDYPLIQNFLQPLYYTGASSNDAHWSNKKFDKLVDQANAAPDQATAVARFQDAEKILAQQMPAIPLWYQNGNGGYSDRLADVTLNPFSVPVYNAITVNG